MAPEQGRGRSHDPRHRRLQRRRRPLRDALGRPAVHRASVVELALLPPPRPPAAAVARFPTSLVEIVERALAKDPARRYADGGEMAVALLEARRSSAGARRARRPSARPGHARAQRAPRRALGVPARRRCRSMRRPGIMPDAPPAAQPAPPAHPRRRRRRLRRPRPVLTAPGAPRSSRRGATSTRRGAAGRSRRWASSSPCWWRWWRRRWSSATRRTRASRPCCTAHRAAPLAALRRAHLRATTAPELRLGRGGDGHRPAPAAAPGWPGAPRCALTISRGPAPVQVPNVVHSSVADAQRALHGLGSTPSLRDVAAPGTAPARSSASPRRAAERPRGSTVTLNVAEVPSWHTVTTFTGGDSGAFRIIGRHWRVVYTMGFRGTCTWILFCSGPTARVVDAATGALRRGLRSPERHRPGPEL